MEGLTNAVQTPSQGQYPQTYYPVPPTASHQNPYQPIPGQVYLLQPPPNQAYGARGYRSTGGGRGRSNSSQTRGNAQYHANTAHPQQWPGPTTIKNEITVGAAATTSLMTTTVEPAHIPSMAMSTMPPARTHTTDARRTNTKHRCDGEGKKLGT
eukprot:CCRYP_003377-RA/>CCRYP_003377-RA protein AED:0.49 eAED:0.45 QI:0/0/0/1/0/0/2/0/153